MAEKRYVGLGKETTFGTAVAATRYAEALESIRPDPGWIIPTPVAQRAYRKKNLGAFRGRGNLEFDVEPENIVGEVLLGVLGSVSSAQQGATSAYKHTFTPGDTLPSWTARIGLELKERIIPGGLINALTIRFAHGADVKGIAEVFGPSVNAESDDTLGTPTLSTLQAFVFHQGVITLAGADKSTEIHDGEVVINNNISYDRGSIGSRFFSKKRVGNRLVTGKLSAYFDSADLRDKFLAGTEFAANFKFTGPQIGTIGYYYTLELDLPKCVYLRDTTPHVRPISETLVLDAPFQAFYKTDTYNAEIKAYLTNEITAY